MQGGRAEEVKSKQAPGGRGERSERLTDGRQVYRDPTSSLSRDGRSPIRDSV